MSSLSSPSKAPTDALGLLQWSMDRYAAMKSFAAEVELRHGPPELIEDAPPLSRRIAYEAPNRFRLESRAREDFSITAVCDGKTFVEYVSGGEYAEAATYPVPPSMGLLATPMSSNPMLCGTLLLPFFGGQGELFRLVEGSRYGPKFDEDDLEADEPTRRVVFYATGLYGNAAVSIGLESGLVRRIVYDSEPLMAMMNDPAHLKRIHAAMQAQIGSMPAGREREEMVEHLAQLEAQIADGTQRTALTVETYSGMLVDELLSSAVFDTTLPAGVQVRDMTPAGRDQPPIPLGTIAPDFEVARLGGGPTKLSDFRGQVVFIDFWATWCGPCRRGLPETARLAALGPSSGLVVMGITKEPAPLVSEFLAEEGLNFPCYIDESGAAQQLYRPPGIPAVVIVDREGIVSDYFIGLQQPATIEAALRKAGAHV